MIRRSRGLRTTPTRRSQQLRAQGETLGEADSTAGGDVQSCCSTDAHSEQKSASVICCPLRVILPTRSMPAANSVPASRLRSAVFPAPDGPITARMLPEDTAPLTPSTRLFDSAPMEAKDEDWAIVTRQSLKASCTSIELDGTPRDDAEDFSIGFRRGPESKHVERKRARKREHTPKMETKPRIFSRLSPSSRDCWMDCAPSCTAGRSERSLLIAAAEPLRAGKSRGNCGRVWAGCAVVGGCAFVFLASGSTNAGGGMARKGNRMSVASIRAGIGAATLLALGSSEEVGGEAMSLASCLHHDPGVYREACQLEFEASKRQELESALGACSWERVDLGTDFGFVWHGPPGSTLGESAAPAEWSTLERCRVGDFERGPSSPSDVGALELHRIGPYATRGGKDWLSVCLGSDLNDLACHTLSANATKDPPFMKSFLGESWRWPPLEGSSVSSATQGRRILGVRESFLGAYDGASTLLGYPPIHQHHFHVEKSGVTLFTAQIITHGDDQCVDSEGGVNCMIRRLPMGFVTPLHLPLSVLSDQQDVRALHSVPMSWYSLLAVRAFPWRREASPFRTLTQMRVSVAPFPMALGFPFATYLVAADQISAFWREGAFHIRAPLVYSYFHTHPANAEDMRFYVNASAEQIGMGRIGISGPNLSNYTRRMLDASLARLTDGATHAYAQLACHYQRSRAS